MPPDICLYIAKGYLPLVYLGFLVHHIKNPLRAGEGGQEKINLLGEAVDGHGALAHVYQVGGQSAQVGQARENEKTSHTGGHRVVDIAERHHRGDGEARVSQGLYRRLAVVFISAAEFLKILGLMVEDLLHLLTGDNLLHKPVHAAQVHLLPGKVFPAPGAVKPDEDKHHGQEEEHDEGEPPAQNKEHGEGSDNGDKALNQHGKTAV